MKRKNPPGERGSRTSALASLLLPSSRRRGCPEVRPAAADHSESTACCPVPAGTRAQPGELPQRRQLSGRGARAAAPGTRPPIVGQRRRPNVLRPKLAAAAAAAATQGPSFSPSSSPSTAQIAPRGMLPRRLLRRPAPLSTSASLRRNLWRTSVSPGLSLPAESGMQMALLRKSKAKGTD